MHRSGNEYLKRFYPDTQWKNNAFNILRGANCLTAEITIPTSTTSGKVIFIKVINESPLNVIDIMGAYCMLDEIKNLIKIVPKPNDKWKELNPQFIYSKNGYNQVLGEIEGFRKDYVDTAGVIKIDKPNCLFKGYGVSLPTKSNNVFVRFFVDPSLREVAEQKLNHKLPDEFCKAHNQSSTIITGSVVINTNYNISGNLSDKEKEILSKPITYTNAIYPQVILPQDQVKTGKTPWGKAYKSINGLAKAKVPDNYPMIVEAGTGASWRYGYSGGAGSRVPYIYIHPLAKDRLENALKDVINHYGPEIASIAPAICKLACSWRDNSQSVHEWGLAIDFNYHNNNLYSSGKSSEASSIINKPIYQPFVDIMEHHGFRSLGRDSKRWGSNVRRLDAFPVLFN